MEDLPGVAIDECEAELGGGPAEAAEHARPLLGVVGVRARVLVHQLAFSAR